MGPPPELAKVGTEILTTLSTDYDLPATLTHLCEHSCRLLGVLDSHPPHTLDQVGAKIGVTRERVRQMELRALANLRQLSEPSGLSQLLIELDGQVA